MKTTIDLPDDLVREVKLRAVMERRTVKDLVTECLSRGMGLEWGKSGSGNLVSPLVEIDGSGLPVIQCAPAAPAASMTAEALLELDRQTQLREDLERAGIVD